MIHAIPFSRKKANPILATRLLNSFHRGERGHSTGVEPASGAADELGLAGRRPWSTMTGD